MEIRDVWETPLRSTVKFSEKVIGSILFESFPYRWKRLLEVGFWGYHFLILAIIFIERFGDFETSIASDMAVPLYVFWGAYAANWVLIWLPSQGVLSLYEFLLSKNISPGQSIAISVLTAVGTLFLIGLYFMYYV